MLPLSAERAAILHDQLNYLRNLDDHSSRYVRSRKTRTKSKTLKKVSVLNCFVKVASATIFDRRPRPTLRYIAHLEAFAGFDLFANHVQHGIDEVGTLGVVAFRPVVPRSSMSCVSVSGEIKTKTRFASILQRDALLFRASFKADKFLKLNIYVNLTTLG